MPVDDIGIRVPEPERERADSNRSLPEHGHSGRVRAGTDADEEVLTYREAAHLLKISPRTLERWTGEGLVPYIRLPQRGRWSGVRFSRNQLLRWLRQRTVRHDEQ
jgi:excisionase family DNA binding protein